VRYARSQGPRAAVRPADMIPAMKITAIETFVVNTGFDGHLSSFQALNFPTGPGWGTDLNEKAARAHPWEG
jgi:hypothetical protein